MSAATIEAPTRQPHARVKRRRGGAPIHVALIAIVAVGLLPYLFVLTTSVKTNEQFATNYWVPSFPLHFENYATAWNQIAPFMLVSIVVAAASIVGIVALSLLSGYVLARFQFPGRRFFFTLVIALLMVPSIASLIPLFVMMRDLGMLNTLWVLIVPRIAGGAVLGTILMKTFIEG
ncbi:MAG: carbohydrate ABC transporter permease, partial [Herbiconiux sp.]|nr:carbohydrate ABC transporter permease [Herbiconiux sp.]